MHWLNSGWHATLQSPKKAKKEKKEDDEVVVRVEDLSPLAKPLAQKKLLKKLHKVVKKGEQFSNSHNRTQIHPKFIQLQSQDKWSEVSRKLWKVLRRVKKGE